MHRNANDDNVTSSQRVNPAPALYAAIVSVVAYGLVVSTFDWIGSSPAGSGVALGSALVSVASAAVALAMVCRDFRPVVAIVAIAGTVIALDLAVAAGIGVVNFPSMTSDRIGVGSLAFLGVALALSTIIAGLAGLGAVAVCRQCFANTDPYHIVIYAFVVNAIVVSTGSAFNELLLDQEFIGLRLTYVDRGVFYGLGEEIAVAAGISAISMTTFPVAFISAAAFTIAIAVRRRYSNDRIDRIVSVTAIGLSILAAAVATLAAVIYVVYVVADTNAYHASQGRDLDVDSAIVAGVVATLGCAITAGLAGIIAWWYRTLRQR